MNFSTSTLFLLSTAVSAAKGFVTPSVFATVGSSPTRRENDSRGRLLLGIELDDTIILHLLYSAIIHSSALRAINNLTSTSYHTRQSIKQYSLSGTATAVERETFQRSLLAAKLANDKVGGLKKAGEDAPPVSLGWDSHNYVGDGEWRADATRVEEVVVASFGLGRDES
eukprot:scaffold935_cov196-Alexandrium_tamarense.AAC.13